MEVVVVEVAVVLRYILAQQLHDEGRRCGRRAGEVHEPRLESERFFLILKGVHDRNREEWRGAQDVTRPFILQCKAIADRVTKRNIARPRETFVDFEHRS